MSTRTDIMNIVCENDAARDKFMTEYRRSLRDASNYNVTVEQANNGAVLTAFLAFDKQKTLDRFARFYYEMAYAEAFINVEAKDVTEWLENFQACPIDLLTQKELLKYLTAWSEAGKPLSFHDNKENHHGNRP